MRIAGLSEDEAVTLARVASCGHITPTGERCRICGTSPAEKAESKRKRSKQSYVEIYGTPRWKALRLEILRRDRFVCQDCGTRATVAAHKQPHNGTGSDPKAWDPRNLKASCASCNAHEANQRVLESQRLGKPGPVDVETRPGPGVVLPQGVHHASEVAEPSRSDRDGRSRQETTTWVI